MLLRLWFMHFLCVKEIQQLYIKFKEMLYMPREDAHILSM